MAVTAGIAAIVVAGAGTAVQANQQKIAAQKQADAASDAQAKQDKLLAEQKAQDTERKKKEDSLTQQAFAKTAASRSRNYSGGALPGAVADQAIGNVGAPVNAGKKLIGS